MSKFLIVSYERRSSDGWVVLPSRPLILRSPVGIGENFGDISKTKPKSSNKSQSGPPGKPSAGDPLAIGEEIGNIGKKK